MVITINELAGSISVHLSGEQWLFQRALKAFKEAIPDEGRAFDRKSGRWLVDPERRQELTKWLTQMRSEFEAEIVYERNVKTEPPPETPPIPASQYATLHLLPTAPPELVKAAYRCLAMLNHPDQGGTNEGMLALNTAYAQLVEVGR